MAYITNFRYYLDKVKKRDLIMSISANYNNIKEWNINIWECLIDIKNIYKNGFLNSGCFLNDNNNIYIVSSNFNYCIFEPIKIFDLNGNEIKKLENSTEKIYFIDSYYDKILSKNFIFTGNIGYVKSYDYNENKIYHKYEDNHQRLHYTIIIYINKENIVKLLASSADGNVRIWNFHSGELLNKIKVSNKGLNSLFLLNNNYLFVGCDDKTIRVIELENEIIVDLITVNQNIITIKGISDTLIGDILLFQGLQNIPIKILLIYPKKFIN